jgi:hypothetical protein
MASRTYGLYRLEFGNKLPTSPPRFGLKKGFGSPNIGQNISNLLKKSIKNQIL